MKLHKITVFLAASLLTGVFAGAQVQGVALPWLEADRNSVTSGMAGASVLRSFESTDVLVSYSSWSKTSTQYFDAIANIVIGDRFLVRAGGTYGIAPAYDVVSGISSTVKTFSPSDMAFGASAMYRIAPAFSLEAGVKYASSKLSPDYTASAFGADVLARAYLSGFSVAAGVVNLGSKVKDYSIPSAAVLAVAYDNGADADHRIRPEVDAKYYFSGVFGLSAGVDYTIKRIVSIRAGYHFGGVVADHASVGLGVNISGFHIDASYLFNTAFCVGVGYSF